MVTTYKLNTRELESAFDAIRTTYPNRDIKILVKEQEIDETEYLLSNPANREHLLRSIEEVKQGKIITFETLEDAIDSAKTKSLAKARTGN